MTLEELLAALGLTKSADIEKAIGDYVVAQTATLKANRDQLLKDVRKLKDDLKAFEGLKGDELAEVLAELDIDAADVIERLRTPQAVDDKNPDVAKRIADAVAAAEAKLQRKIANAEKKAADAEAAVVKANDARIQEHIQRELTSAIAENKGNVDLLLPMLKGRVKGEIDPDTGEIRTTVFDVVGGEMQGAGGAVATVKTLVETIKADEKFGAVFEADGGGSGAKGAQNRQNSSGVKNPWLTATLNRTEQARLKRDKPALAAQLEAAAQRANAQTRAA